jgi:hypothetical protein
MSHTTAIAGVSPGREAAITTVWPSIAAWAPGRRIGALNDCIPLRINGIKLSVMIFALPLMPVALTLYVLMKVFSVRYRVTNRSVQSWKTLGSRMIQSVPLADIHEIHIEQRHGQAFYKASDVELIGADGGMLMRMPGIPYAEGFKKNLLEIRESTAMTTASLQTIQARA